MSRAEGHASPHESGLPGELARHWPAGSPPAKAGRPKKMHVKKGTSAVPAPRARLGQREAEDMPGAGRSRMGGRPEAARGGQERPRADRFRNGLGKGMAPARLSALGQQDARSSQRQPRGSQETAQRKPEAARRRTRSSFLSRHAGGMPPRQAGCRRHPGQLVCRVLCQIVCPAVRSPVRAPAWSSGRSFANLPGHLSGHLSGHLFDHLQAVWQVSWQAVSQAFSQACRHVFWQASFQLPSSLLPVAFQLFPSFLPFLPASLLATPRDGTGPATGRPVAEALVMRAGEENVAFFKKMVDRQKFCY